MFKSLFGNKEVKAAEKWCADYAQHPGITAQVIEAVQCGSTAQQAIELGRSLNYRLCQQVQQENDTQWAQQGSRADRGR